MQTPILPDNFCYQASPSKAFTARILSVNKYHFKKQIPSNSFTNLHNGFFMRQVCAANANKVHFLELLKRKKDTALFQNKKYYNASDMIV